MRTKLLVGFVYVVVLALFFGVGELAVANEWLPDHRLMRFVTFLFAFGVASFASNRIKARLEARELRRNGGFST